MASDPTAKAAPAPKKDAPAPKKEAVAVEKSASDAAPAKTEAPKAEAGETAAAAPKNYSRGEGQKPVTQAYKDNWNAIFAPKKAVAKNKTVAEKKPSGKKAKKKKR